ncbi:GNAT family N-acetyltransferase [Flavivirga abyssicola]|uniref:GNAT family N-acetyltransferase n=1 Tax=Flavivirga abyssicola TaxID=3063533 RepID=UPI0026DFBF88|nr:GNAT family N-acetyltransferase [Flavivirga sp. MEBiC07777]WVK13014.1 GNAT family N-acetyltransferase [Flavivirga sp. MEBiC07777]
METHKKISDITFIGSGISTSFSIINFLDQINNEVHVDSKISISIIEKYSEFNIGIPYGTRSGFSTLLITSLRNFLIEPELGLFIKWLNKNKTWLLNEFEKEGGALSKKWLLDNEEKISNNNWEDLFIPRRFFGCYINLRVNNKIKELTEKGLVNVNFVTGEVIDLDKNKSNYKIFLENGTEISAKKVVLSVGSLPINYLWRNKDLIEEKNLLFVNNPYKPELKVILEKVENFINNRDGEVTNVLIVGANASALELIYKLNDYTKNKHNETNFTFLSTHGTVPDAVIDFEKQKEFVPNHLNELKKEKKITAKAIAEATFKDLDSADQINLGAASTVEIISKYFGVLLETLSSKELKKFACKYGNQIGRRQRCAGLHYSNVITGLEKENRFEHIRGRFNDLVESDANGNYSLKYLDTSTKKEKTHDKHFHLVVNCVGSKNLDKDDIPAIHQNLIRKGYCIPNESKIGFHVNDSLEASKDLYIMGPMLAGNVIEKKPIWHVEHCGRIIGLSKILSKIIADDLFKPKNYKPKDYKLVVNNLDNDLDIIKYKKLLKENWNNNIYYAYDHLKYFEKNKSTLKYFLFEVNGFPKILMPIILRIVKSKETNSEYFDAITPYGYNGPLYNDATELDLKEFWKAVDNWYKKNNVITEFIRFSLNKNYLGYTGLLINSLSNVKGILYNDFEKQWDAFSSKVRNNYRKAISFKLGLKIFNNTDINEDVIKIFFDIYTETMVRHNAKKIYFFSLEYFKNLILNNVDEFAIAMAYQGDIPVSAELIIKNGTTFFAFLGGTDSNYYNQRPNDFLRVEIIKWAIKNNFKQYILGGGLKNNDGLYKSKKALFPKDEDVTFYTGRKIIDYKAYDKLCENHMDDYANIHEEELKNYFFPLYRFNNR